MAKITSTEARMSIYQGLAPHIADLSEQLGYIVPIYWPALDYAQRPNVTQVYVEVEESSIDKEAEGIEAISGSDATEQLRVTIMMTEKQGDLKVCKRAADDMVAHFSRGRLWFDLDNDKSVVLYPCVQEPMTVRDGRRLLPFLITFNYETV